MSEWLTGMTVDQLHFMQGIARIIQGSTAASPSVDEASDDIQYALETLSHRKHAFKGYPKNDTIKSSTVAEWLVGKKKQYRERVQD